MENQTQTLTQEDEQLKEKYDSIEIVPYKSNYIDALSCIKSEQKKNQQKTKRRLVCSMVVLVALTGYLLELSFLNPLEYVIPPVSLLVYMYILWQAYKGMKTNKKISRIDTCINDYGTNGMYIGLRKDNMEMRLTNALQLMDICVKRNNEYMPVSVIGLDVVYFESVVCLIDDEKKRIGFIVYKDLENGW